MCDSKYTSTCFLSDRPFRGKTDVSLTPHSPLWWYLSATVATHLTIGFHSNHRVTACILYVFKLAVRPSQSCHGSYWQKYLDYVIRWPRRQLLYTAPNTLWHLLSSQGMRTLSRKIAFNSPLQASTHAFSVSAELISPGTMEGDELSIVVSRLPAADVTLHALRGRGEGV